MKNLFQHAKIMRFAIICSAVIGAGLLYSCSFKTNTGNSREQLLLESETNTHEFTESTEAIRKTEQNYIYVYVCGCVNVPGVYEVTGDMRVYQLIELSGGFTDEANDTYLNMAEYVTDGQRLYVPDKEEQQGDSFNVQTGQTASALVNINKATKEQLMTLPGIGESRANDIISYRSNNGKFNSIDDIKNVSGIKEAAFNKIKELITV